MNGQARLGLGNGATPVVITLVSLAAVGMFVAGATNFTGRGSAGTKLTGTYTAAETGAFTANRDCKVQGVQDGSPVAIRNGAGEVIRIGRAVGGLGVKLAGDTDKASGCRFTFVVTKVPSAEAYQIRVGAAEPHSFTAAELAAVKWNVDLT